MVGVVVDGICGFDEVGVCACVFSRVQISIETGKVAA
jgi:hypothetical protein